MSFALVAIVLALIWAAITASFTLPNLVLGGAIAFVVLWFIRERIAGPKVFRRFWRFSALTLLFFYELLLRHINTQSARGQGYQICQKCNLQIGFHRQWKCNDCWLQLGPNIGS